MCWCTEQQANRTELLSGPSLSSSSKDSRVKEKDTSLSSSNNLTWQQTDIVYIYSCIIVVSKLRRNNVNKLTWKLFLTCLILWCIIQMFSCFLLMIKYLLPIFPFVSVEYLPFYLPYIKPIKRTSYGGSNLIVFGSYHSKLKHFMCSVWL